MTEHRPRADKWHWPNQPPVIHTQKCVPPVLGAVVRTNYGGALVRQPGKFLLWRHRGHGGIAGGWRCEGDADDPRDLEARRGVNDMVLKRGDDPVAVAATRAEATRAIAARAAERSAAARARSSGALAGGISR
jgi:hypothetical protein